MGSFTKVYSRTFHPEESLTLSWDMGYRNVTLYDGKRVVRKWEQSKQFIEGVSFQDQELGPIQVKFTETKPLQLALKVNGKKYKPTKEGKPQIDLTGQTTTYWTLMAFTLLLLIVSIAMFRVYLFRPESLMINGYLLGVAFVYFLTAYLMFKKFTGAFFIGYCYVFLHLVLLFVVIAFVLREINIPIILFFLVRLGIFVYLTLSIRKVTYVMKNKSNVTPTDILDEKL